ncbi:MAG TPA: FliH/SctL family protein [Syntrophomonadaceae bacterium]|nr:FliH/SctL family protein [Syntrophomonadaceae bacterium]HQA08457.1 FliH/SctL family protein [Syntrophomonadaceae bacterium]HQE23503.1 FliH/SctL family protein [Syntrophomonadaceae bacterium]
MSRVIKGVHLQIFEPRLIELSDIVTCLRSEELEEAQAAEQEDMATVEQVEQEAARILQETEQMVVDLLQKARNQAHEILDNAREEAEVTLSKAQEEAHQLREKAFQEGYQEGLESARQAMQKEINETNQQCQQMLEEARNTKLAMFRTCESDMIKLSLAVAKRVVATEITTNPQVVASILQEALSYIDQPDNLTLYVNQRDLETIQELMQTHNYSDIGSKTNLQVQVDNRISPGGLKLDSESGTVDARIETRLANVEKAFQEVLSDE